MFGLTLLDWAVIVFYLLGITVIGSWAAKKVSSAASFFIGDRKFGKLMMTFFTFGTGTHSDQAVSVAAKTYQVGVSGIWYQWLWLFITPFFWLMAPFFRRTRAVTTADYFEARYNQSVSLLFAIMGMLQLTVNIAVMLKGASAMITAVSGHQIDPRIAITAMTVMFVIYGIAGGLSAAIVTDFIQGLLTIVLSFLILPIALSSVGGISGLHQSITDSSMFEIVAPGEINMFFIVVISLNALVGWAAQPHCFSICAAGRTEMDGRVGVTLGLFIKRFCTIAWVLTGLCAVAIYAGEDIDIDHVYGLMARDLLPTVSAGLIGIFIASMLAAVMSSCDAFMVSSAALFTENIYRKHFSKDRSDKHYILVGRVASAVIVACAAILAFSLKSVVEGLEIFWEVSAVMGLAFWAGLFWRRVTVAGAWAATLGTFVAMIFTSSITVLERTIWDFNVYFARFLPSFMLWEGELYLPWKMIIYLSVGLILLVVVSLFTRRVSREKLDRFYKCLRTPVTEDEPETEPFTLPEGIKPAPRNPLFKHPDWEIGKPHLVDVVGFIASCVGVGILVALVYWIVSL